MEALEITDVLNEKCAEIQIKRWSFIHQRQTYKDLLSFFGFYLQFQLKQRHPFQSYWRCQRMD